MGDGRDYHCHERGTVLKVRYQRRSPCKEVIPHTTTSSSWKEGARAAGGVGPCAGAHARPSQAIATKTCEIGVTPRGRSSLTYIRAWLRICKIVEKGLFRVVIYYIRVRGCTVLWICASSSHHIATINR
ncbi:unnamed protein product [Trichogramma brassicae]|uniref:Uncharacterized protein n=1 Tax=Trichogramma brassicae TaxID=86971 RepID=A0A6H5ISV4_9HYME|nr:unnamed protein product [Trichogramma brassicae]